MAGILEVLTLYNVLKVILLYCSVRQLTMCGCIEAKPIKLEGFNLDASTHRKLPHTT